MPIITINLKNVAGHYTERVSVMREWVAGYQDEGIEGRRRRRGQCTAALLGCGSSRARVHCSCSREWELYWSNVSRRGSGRSRMHASRTHSSVRREAEAMPYARRRRRGGASHRCECSTRGFRATASQHRTPLLSSSLLRRTGAAVGAEVRCSRRCGRHCSCDKRCACRVVPSPLASPLTLIFLFYSLNYNKVLLRVCAGAGADGW